MVEAMPLRSITIDSARRTRGSAPAPVVLDISRSMLTGVEPGPPTYSFPLGADLRDLIRLMGTSNPPSMRPDVKPFAIADGSTGNTKVKRPAFALWAVSQ